MKIAIRESFNEVLLPRALFVIIHSAHHSCAFPLFFTSFVHKFDELFHFSLVFLTISCVIFICFPVRLPRRVTRAGFGVYCEQRQSVIEK